MNWDNHPYLMIYIIGCVIQIFFNLFQAGFFLIIDWITKENILAKNINKIGEPPDPLSTRMITFFTALVVEAIFSWINVVFGVFYFVYRILSLIRKLITPLPEEIKQLIFPLKNNPDLSREAVWAYTTALRIKGGEQLNASAIRDGLEMIKFSYASFDSISALNILKSLNVVPLEFVSNLIESWDTFKTYPT